MFTVILSENSDSAISFGALEMAGKHGFEETKRDWEIARPPVALQKPGHNAQVAFIAHFER